MKRLLLISNSTQHGGGYLDHCAEEIRDFLAAGSVDGGREAGGRDTVERVLFVPYALHDRDGYAAKARERFGAMGFGMDSVHQADDPVEAVEGAEAIFTGGGNTFRLVAALHDVGLMPAIRRRVAEGMPYFGASAGSNVACPTLCTTNDMPIVEPASFETLGLVPFQINPHYLDPDPASTHKGETREQRITEYLEESERVVVGLREGSMLRVEGGTVELKGGSAARVFRRGCEPEELEPGTRLDGLMEER